MVAAVSYDFAAVVGILVFDVEIVVLDCCCCFYVVAIRVLMV